MKYTGKQFLADVVSSLVFVLTVASAQCPHNALHKVQLCTSSILPKWSTGTNFGVSRHHTRETCRTKLHDCADCIQKIMDQCQGTTEQEQILQRLINKQKLLETVEYFCHNFRVYEKNVDCISKHHTDVAVCTEPARISFQQKLVAGATMDVLITGTCRFNMEGASVDGPGDNSQLDNSYLQGQYVVEGTDDDAVASGDNEEEQKDKSPLREQDRFLPIANVARIMKKSIPKTGKIAKDAKECVQECVSEFISFITSEASERCHQEKRKTINGEDILFAMSTLGFDSYVEPLKLYLQKYREAMKGDKGATNRHEEMDEMGDETYGLSQGLTANILSTDQGAQQGVIFTNFTNQSYAM